MTSTRNVFLRFALVGLAWTAFGLGASLAQFTTGFEPDDYLGASNGVPLTGQQSWYIPAPSSDHFAFTYDSNGLGLPVNAFGDTQFIGAQASGNGTFSRAQLNFDWSGCGVLTVSYDLCVQYNGSGTAVDNISSFSLQDSLVSRYFIAVNTWAMQGLQWNANYQ